VSFRRTQERAMAATIALVVDGRLKRDARRAGVTPGELLSAEVLGRLYPLLADPRVPWGGN
jgi:hypothetical protein